MHFLQSLLATALPSVAAASYFPRELPQARSLDASCGMTGGGPRGLLRAIDAHRHNERDVAPRSDNSTRTPSVVVHFHVATVKTSGENDADYASDEVLMEQFNIMKETYADYSIVLNFGSITREINKTVAVLDDWTMNEEETAVIAMSPALQDYLTRTRKGSYETLNVYFWDNIVGTAAFCNFPNPDLPVANYWLDGCHLRSNTLPGGTAKYRGHGTSAVHEVGHWFGLFHIFEGGCEGEGDYVDDTPASQETSADGTCDDGKDSCPDLPGLDAVDNFMDYTTDPCRNKFTPGQNVRMHNMFWSIRAGK